MKVEHDPEKHKFFMKLGEYEATLMYAEKERVLDFYHIYVPDPFRNRGIAAKILMAAFDCAAKEGYRVIPTCPFIRNDFLPRFPQYQKLTEPGEFPFAGR